jgi:hypothetical protein
VLLALLASLPLSATLATQDTLSRTFPGRGGPAVTLPRIEQTAIVDGRLDEDAWTNAARLVEFSQYEPVDSRPAEERTEVRVWYAPDAIWFGIIAYDSDPSSIRASNADRDQIDNDDKVRIYLDTFDDRRRAYFFGVNPFGAQEDGVRTEGAASAGNIFGGSIDETPDFLWESKGRLTERGYEVEIRIPFKSLRYGTAEVLQWGIQVVREVKRTGYTDTWTDARRANASFLDQSGRFVDLRDLKRGVVAEYQPTFTSVWPGLRGTDNTFVRKDATSDIGLNVRLGFTSMTLDATWNPDFSQVEADAGQVTLNQRFALFFEERRQFFLEGIELFSTPNQLVYTRTIGEPQVGLKLTGKLGGTTIAYLGALDRIGGETDALVNVARVRQDFGTSSYLGLTVTDRTEGLTTDNDLSNRVASLDLRYVFGGMYYAAAQLGGSWTDDVGPGDTRSGAIWQAELDRTGRHWGFNYKIVGFGEDFESRSGFVNRTGVVTGHIFNRFSWYGDRGALVENFTTFFGPRRVWDYGSFEAGDAIEGRDEANFNFRLKGGWNVEVQGAREFFEFEPELYAGFTHDTGTGAVPFEPRDQYDGGRSIEIGIETPTWQRFGAELSYSGGRTAIFDEASDGAYSAIEAGISFRPAAAIRLEFTTLYATIWRVRDDSEFGREIIPRVRAEFQPTRALSFRFVGQYTSARRASLEDSEGNPITGGDPAGESHDLRIDFLGSYEPSPGTVVFLGYGSGYDGPSTLSFRQLIRREDVFFVKLAYLYRR